MGGFMVGWPLVVTPPYLYYIHFCVTCHFQPIRWFLWRIWLVFPTKCRGWGWKRFLLGYENDVAGNNLVVTGNIFHLQGTDAWFV